MFRSVLVANRGEIALRIIRALRELKIRSVAVYSEADRGSPHLEEADGAVAIGGPRSAESYLDMEAILAAAEKHECQAVHPGFGFLAENALFAALCHQAKVTFIGPPPAAIRRMGVKAAARETMRAAGLDPIPGSRGVVGSIEEASEAAGRIGYPVLPAFKEARMEAEKAFGDGSLYLERFVRGGRHIEFQILADVYGNAICLGERECSVQRNHQKLIEESPSPAISAELRAAMGAKVARAVARIGYVNAGTVEFLRDPEGNLYFMEMNTRLQVEHPVTEMVTGVDIVKEQIAIAANCPLSIRAEDVKVTGHAIEARINAEDPDAGFKPNPGKVERFDPPPAVDGVRVDTHVREGYVVPPFYDSMIAKLIVHGSDRAAAIDKLLEALDRFRIEGVKTTIPFHREVLSGEEFRSGRYDTGLVKRLLDAKGGSARG
ncbi:MAG: acetyl-CoA carboxylase biotin carboxylase subunit [Planctomycetes bacterium]|nr:acetyl-CoA carboxylase biotin carboxylase subunit [Planctomycetota bacterium]